jgi:sulfur-carrier protein
VTTETNATIRVVLPHQLRLLAHVDSEVQVEIDGAVTPRSVIRAVERRYPMLEGAIFEHENGKRRAKIRFFACRQDVSHDSPDATLPDAVRTGQEPFIVLGAIASG